MDKRNGHRLFPNKIKSFLSAIRVIHGKKGLQGILILLSVIMIIGSFTFYIPSFASEIDQAKDKKSALEKKKAETEAKLSELEKEKDDILKYIEELDAELGKLTDEITSLNDDIEKANAELVTAKAELEEAKKTEAEQYSIMKKRIKYMYENGDTNYLELILQSDNLSDALNQVEYMSKITEYDNNLLDNYKKLKQDVADKEKNLETKLASLQELKDELTYEQDTVERLAQDKNEELVKYEGKISETQTLSDQYSTKLQDQEDLIENLLEAERKRIEEEERKKEEERKRKEEEEKQRQEQEKQEQENANSDSGNNSSSGSNSGDNSSSDNSSSGDSSDDSSGGTHVDGFIWPCPSSTRITSYFGNRDQPTEGASTYHKGIDIGASVGSEIVAAASGSVVTAAYSVSAGNYIMIYHGDGVYTVYMHCSKLMVSAGQEVSQGQTIGLVGSTGVSTGPHLHFGVSVNGTYVNPLNYVSN